MALYEKGAKGIVPYRGDISQEALSAIDRADDDAIAKHLVSPFGAEHFLYSYPIQTAEGTKQIIGIGVDGGYEIAHLMGNVEVLPNVKVEEKGDYFYGCVWAKDLIRNVTLMGVARQCKFILGKGNEPTNRLDETAFVKAITKGQRNAILAIAPQEAIAKAIETFMQNKKLKALAPVSDVPSKAPEQERKHVDDIRPEELTKAAKELGYTSKEEIYQTLGVKNIGEWKSQGKSLKEASEFLKKHKEALVKAIQDQLNDKSVQEQLSVTQEDAPAKDDEPDKVDKPAPSETKGLPMPNADAPAKDNAPSIDDVEF